MEHKIKDCPLAVPRTKSPPKDFGSQSAEVGKTEEVKKDEWVTVGRRNKLAKQPALASSSQLSPLAIEVSTETIAPISNPASQGKEVFDSHTIAPLACTPQAAAEIASSAPFRHSRSPPRCAENGFEGLQEK